ncbi:hypothetical protein [Streptomyces sp. NPDC089915]|uniref:hypothetical protein n=1 Tax=Streptomyces sp. NPDC089915 TaxID=3155186 RepID=UPI00343F7E1B
MTPASTPPAPFVHRITKYDPADRNEHGHYTGTEEAVSDHGPVEAAYLAAVAAFAEESGVDRLAVREPGVAGLAWFGLEPAIRGHGLAGLFPSELTVWPDLSPDVGAVLAGLPGDDMVEFVWEDGDGVITGVNVDETEHRELARLVAGARAAAVLPLSVDERVPLLAAVLPDADGVLRARWRTEPVPDVRPWTRLKSLDPGTVCTAALGPTGPGPRERWHALPPSGGTGVSACGV